MRSDTDYPCDAYPSRPARTVTHPPVSLLQNQSRQTAPVHTSTPASASPLSPLPSTSRHRNRSRSAPPVLSELSTLVAELQYCRYLPRPSHPMLPVLTTTAVTDYLRARFFLRAKESSTFCISEIIEAAISSPLCRCLNVCMSRQHRDCASVSSSAVASNTGT